MTDDYLRVLIVFEGDEPHEDERQDVCHIHSLTVDPSDGLQITTDACDRLVITPLRNKDD